MKKIVLILICHALFMQYSQGQEKKTPSEVIYHEASDEVNSEAKKLISQAINENKLLPINKTFICGPNLWRMLVKNGVDKKVSGINVNFHIPSKNGTKIVQGRAIQKENEYQIIWNTLFSDVSNLKIRKPTPAELSQYWAIISYEIEEPVFVVEIGTSKFIIDLDSNTLKLHFIEAL